MIYDPILTALVGSIKAGNGKDCVLTDEKLRKVSREFESMFLYELLKNMDTSGGMFGKGLGGDVFNTLFKMELSREMASRGTGLGRLIYESLKRNLRYNVKENSVLDDNTVKTENQRIAKGGKK